MHPIDRYAMEALVVAVLAWIFFEAVAYGAKRLERYVARKYPSDRP